MSGEVHVLSSVLEQFVWYAESAQIAPNEREVRRGKDQSSSLPFLA